MLHLLCLTLSGRVEAKQVGVHDAIGRSQMTQLALWLRRSPMFPSCSGDSHAGELK